MLKDFDDNFKWQFDGSHFIDIGTNFRMELHNWMKTNGVIVQIYAAANNDNQKWYLISRGSKST